MVEYKIIGINVIIPTVNVNWTYDVPFFVNWRVASVVYKIVDQLTPQHGSTYPHRWGKLSRLTSFFRRPILTLQSDATCLMLPMYIHVGYELVYKTVYLLSWPWWYFKIYVNFTQNWLNLYRLVHVHVSLGLSKNASIHRVWMHL